MSRLRAGRVQEALAKAREKGIIAADEPSPALLLRVFKEVLDGKHDDLVASGAICKPTPRQLEALEALSEGLTPGQAARRMGNSVVAVCNLRLRLWKSIGATDMRSALHRIEKLGLLQRVGDALKEENDET
jgi:DNA-binding NarL/FixJ family response regulator